VLKDEFQLGPTEERLGQGRGILQTAKRRESSHWEKGSYKRPELLNSSCVPRREGPTGMNKYSPCTKP